MSNRKMSYNQAIESLHENIRNGERSTVENLLKRWCDVNDFEHFYNDEMESAAAIAVKFRRVDFYELLVSFGVNLGLHERVDELTDDPVVKKKIHDIHRRNFKDSILQHLQILVSKSKFSHDHEASGLEWQTCYELVIQAFADLNSFEVIEPVLKIASTCSKLKFVFDFNHDTVERMDPSKGRNILGTTFTDDKYIYIGALPLSEGGEAYCRVLGVLAHELCHFAMMVVYKNECKPYRVDDQVKMVEFEDVSQITKTKTYSEDFIQSVYDYSTSRHHAELIVRVPHLVALYKNDEDKLTEVSKEFHELFTYYKSNNIDDLEAEYPMLQAKNEIRELNNTCMVQAALETSDIKLSPEGLKIDFDTNDRILLVSSNCARITMQAIFQRVCAEDDFESFYIFADSKVICNEMMFGSVAKALQLCNKPKLIVHCDGNGNDIQKVFQAILEMKIEQRIVLVSNYKYDSFTSSTIEVKHTWEQLSRNSQYKLMQKKVYFQGSIITLGELSANLQSVKEIPFDDLLDDKKVSVGSDLCTFFKTEDFVARKFSKIVEDQPFEFSFNGLKVQSETDNHESLSLGDVLNLVEQKQSILLCDEPGMGKSTLFNVLQKELKEKYPTYWVILMDLKKYCKAFQPQSKITIIFENSLEIVSFLSTKILKLRNFDSQVFTTLFNDNRVIILMDGMDEICPGYEHFVSYLMTAIIRAPSKNQLWVSTRPHLLSELNNSLHPIMFRLQPFTRENRHDFFSKFFKSIDLDDRNITEKLEEIEIFLENLRSKSFNFESISNPLLLKMIAECFDIDENFSLPSANLYTIYKQFTMKMVEKSIEKGGEEINKSLSKDYGKSDTVKFYQKKAFETCFDDWKLKPKVDSMIHLCFRDVSEPSLADFTRVGLMFSDGAENVSFIHRTFGEFYVSMHFFETIFARQYRSEEELKATIRMFIGTLADSEANMMISALIDNALENFIADKRSTMAESALEDIFEQINFKFVEQLVRNGCLSLIRIFAFNLPLLTQELLLKKGKNNKNILMTAAECKSII